MTFTKTNRRGRNGSSRSQRPSFSNSKPRHGNFNGGGRGKQSRGSRKMPTFNPSQFINTHPVEATEEVYNPKHRFDTLGLNLRLVRTIASLKIETPTPIQDQIIPEILAGRDVIGLAETGTGKTAAFLIPLIEKTIKNPKNQTLILAPTRELALQLGEEVRKLSNGFRIFSAICVGGLSIRPQIKILGKTNQFIVGTPGRILDLIKHKHITPKNITTVVLDEADRMLDMGFINDVRTILSSIPTNRETHCFSATMSNDIKKIVHDFLSNPLFISVKKQDITNSIEQDVIRHNKHNKFETLLKILNSPESKRVLIFGSMKYSVQRLAQQISTSGMPAESIHGNKNHAQRQKALTKFKRGETRVLVATDVAARGIHIEDISHVINYDLPNTFEDYIHRVGRTGRVTKRGKALTFVPMS